MKIASDVFLLAQRPAEDQPNEQEEGCWQPGTGPIQTGTVYPTSRSTSECMTTDGTHPPPFVRLPATRHLNIIFHTDPKALCSVSTQLSVWPRAKCRTVVHYEILLLAPPPRAALHILHNAAQRGSGACYTLIGNSCGILKETRPFFRGLEGGGKRRVAVTSARSEVRCKISEVSFIAVKESSCSSADNGNFKKSPPGHGDGQRARFFWGAC